MRQIHVLQIVLENVLTLSAIRIHNLVHEVCNLVEFKKKKRGCLAASALHWTLEMINRVTSHCLLFLPHFCSRISIWPKPLWLQVRTSFKSYAVLLKTVSENESHTDLERLSGSYCVFHFLWKCSHCSFFLFLLDDFLFHVEKELIDKQIQELRLSL